MRWRALLNSGSFPKLAQVLELRRRRRPRCDGRTAAAGGRTSRDRRRRRPPRGATFHHAPVSCSSRPMRSANAFHAARLLACVGFGRPLPTQREEIEIVVAGNGEEHPLVLPAGERGLDELEADAVVGEVSRDDDGVGVGLLDRLRRRGADARSSSAASLRRDAGARPRLGTWRASTDARRASSRHAFAAARSTGSSTPPRLLHARDRDGVALRDRRGRSSRGACRARGRRASPPLPRRPRTSRHRSRRRSRSASRRADGRGTCRRTRRRGGPRRARGRSPRPCAT